jgi:hypothetical protein
MTRNLTLALVVAACLAAPAAAQQGWAEKMFKGELAHDFGVVPRGAERVHRFTITNIYAVRMEITSIKSGCGCVTASAAKRVLEPRESTEVEVRMDTKRFTGPKTVGVRVTVGPEYISSAELRVTANSRADVVFNPGECSFGTVTRGQSPTVAIDVEYAGRLAWQISEVVARDVPFTATFKEVYRQPGKVGYRLFVTLNPDAPVGMLKHDLYLKTNDPASPMVPVLVEATVQAAVTVTPEVLSLGPVKADAPLVRRVVVRGNKPFRVTGVEGTGNGIELEGPLGEREEMVQFVTFKCQVTAAGAFKRVLKVKTTAQDAPVAVTIEGTVSK